MDYKRIYGQLIERGQQRILEGIEKDIILFQEHSVVVIIKVTLFI
jgi:hypothetical protein